MERTFCRDDEESSILLKCNVQELFTNGFREQQSVQLAPKREQLTILVRGDNFSSTGSLENRVELRHSQPHDRGREGEPLDLKGNIIGKRGAWGAWGAWGARASAALRADAARWRTGDLDRGRAGRKTGGCGDGPGGRT